jgi:hypothetical protein
LTTPLVSNALVGLVSAMGHLAGDNDRRAILAARRHRHHHPG